MSKKNKAEKITAASAGLSDAMLLRAGLWFKSLTEDQWSKRFYVYDYLQTDDKNLVFETPDFDAACQFANRKDDEAAYYVTPNKMTTNATALPIYSGRNLRALTGDDSEAIVPPSSPALCLELVSNGDLNLVKQEAGLTIGLLLAQSIGDKESDHAIPAVAVRAATKYMNDPRVM